MYNSRDIDRIVIENYSFEKLYELVCEKINQDKHVKMDIRLEKSSKDNKEFGFLSVSCFEDYYRGIVVHIHTSQHKEECIYKDSNYKSILKKQAERSFHDRY